MKNSRARARVFIDMLNFERKKFTHIYFINIASPKLKNLYLFFTAVSYKPRICSLPVSAATSIMSVLSGKWKFVISASTHLNLYGG